MVVALALALMLGDASARAGTFGVPTNLNLNGNISLSSAPPAGWFVLGNDYNLSGSVVDPGGVPADTIDIYIEVTGTTLDLLMFDPGTKSRWDLNGDGKLRMNFELHRPEPDGSIVVSKLNVNDDNGATDGQLARLGPDGNFHSPEPTDIAPGNLALTGLEPGLYKLRIFATTSGAGIASTDLNFFGIDIREGICPATGFCRPADWRTEPHYNVYTTATADVHTAGMSIGGNDCGKTSANGSNNTQCDQSNPHALITEPVVFYPYVDRGCGIVVSNDDMDNLSTGAAITDTVGVSTGLAISGPLTTSATAVSVEDPSVQNLESTNYGIYTLAADLGVSPFSSNSRLPANSNDSLWAVSDYQSGPLLTPTGPIRTYLPNGPGVAPLEPAAAVSTRVVSGANPPQPGQVTRFSITASVQNTTTFPMSDVLVNVPLVSGATFAIGTGTIDGVAFACTPSAGSGSVRCTFPTLAGGSIAAYAVEVDYTPASAGLKNLTGPPVIGSPLADSTVWAQYNPASSGPGFPRAESLGPLCNLTVDVGASALATRATLRGLRVDRSGVVEFVTGSQHASAGFEIYGTDALSGTPRVRLDRGGVRAPVPTTGDPTLYRVETLPVSSRYVLIEEIDSGGRRHRIGPIAVGDPRLAASLTDLERRLEGSRVPAHQGARVVGRDTTLRVPRSRPLHRLPGSGSGAPGVKIEVGRAGRVRVPFSTLQQAGLPGRFEQLRLTNQGRDVAFDVLATGDGNVLAFEAESLSTAYTGRNVYVLTWGTAAMPTMSAALTVWDAPRPPGTVRIERSAIYVSDVIPGADPWLWDLLFSDNPGWPYDWDPDAGSFDLPDLEPGASGDVPLRIRFLGRSEGRHSIAASINGVAVGSVAFDGAVPATLVGKVPADALRVAGNELSLTYAAEAAPDGLGLVYLDAMDIAAPVHAPAADVVPDRVAPWDPRLPSTRLADYLIVSHREFLDQARRMAGLEEKHRVVVVDVERAYDAFSGGIVEAHAVQALVRRSAAAGSLRYVALLGGDSVDPRDFLGTGAVSFIPSLLAWDGEHGRVPSENLYADVDADGRPDVAIGRLPARSVAEAAAMVDKVAGAFAAPSRPGGAHLFATDNQGPGDQDFRAEAQAVAAGLPAASSRTFADVALGVDAARQILLARMRGGVSFVHYFGHGGPQVWADEGLLTVDDVPLLQDSPEAVVLSWACEAQDFQYLFGPSLSQALLDVTHGGARGAFGPAGITRPAQQRPLYQELYRQLPGAPTLGEAIRRAKSAAVASDPAARPAVEGWNLLGDPALPLSTPR